MGWCPVPKKCRWPNCKALPQFTVPATLECTGNGRGFYLPKVPGIQWKRGAVGNAEWQGPRLSDVLKLAGMNDAAAFVEIDGADIGVAQTPDFVRSMPMKKAMHPATILALKMNGETPQIHGFPARLVVPGWDGTSWVKWVMRLTPQAKESTGFFMNPGYRIPRIPLAAGDAGAPRRTGSDRRHAGEILDHAAGGRNQIRDGSDSGEWHRLGRAKKRLSAWMSRSMAARVGRPPLYRRRSCTSPGAYGMWIGRRKAPVTTPFFRAPPIPPGRVQPFVPAWNPSGYLWNGIDRIGVTVEAKA